MIFVRLLENKLKEEAQQMLNVQKIIQLETEKHTAVILTCNQIYKFWASVNYAAVIVIVKVPVLCFSAYNARCICFFPTAHLFAEVYYTKTFL